MDLDLSQLSLTAILTYAVLLAAIDVAWNVVLSFVHRNFSLAYVADFLTSHVLVRIVPIALLAIAGHGIPALGVPELAIATLAAAAGLAAYALETIGSLKGALSDTKPAPA